MSLARNAAAIFVFVATALLTAAPSTAQERVEFGPFYYFTNEPQRLYLDGPIADDASQELLDNLAELSEATTLILNSATGTLVEAMVVAEIVHARGLDTLVPVQSTCSGPCFVVFMAGIGRTSDGNLAIVRMHDPITDEYMNADEMIAILEEALIRYGASPAVADIFANLTIGGAHIFSQDDIATLGLARTNEEGRVQAAAAITRPLSPPPDLDAVYAQYGNVAGGMVMLFDADGGTTGQVPAQTSWGVTADGGSLRALVTAVDGSLVATLKFWPLSTADRPYFGDLIVVDFLQPLSFSPLARLRPLSVGTAAGYQREIFYFQELFTGTIDDFALSRFYVYLPLIYSDLVRKSYADSDRFNLLLEFTDGTAGAFFFEMGEGGRAAFDAALQAWER